MIESKKQHRLKILIADDHALIREALKHVIEKESDMEVIAEVEDGLEAVESALRLIPDIIIMDFNMPKLNGLEATRQILKQCPAISILVLTVYTDLEHIYAILEAGAASYLPKTVSGEVIPRTIRAIRDGEAVLTQAIWKELLKHISWYANKSVQINNVQKLTTREIDILKLAAKGMSNKEIAARLGLSVTTVKNYFAEIFSKLNVNSRTEAVITAVKSKIVTLDDA